MYYEVFEQTKNYVPLTPLTGTYMGCFGRKKSKALRSSERS